MPASAANKTELYVTNAIRVPMAEIHFTFVRSSGPGGQNVNKVNSKACLRWNIAASTAIDDAVRSRFTEKFGSRINSNGEVLIDSQRFRDQPRNTTDCLNKLADMIRSVSQPPRPRRRTRPTGASKQRRLKDKKFNSERKRLRRRPTGDD